MLSTVRSLLITSFNEWKKLSHGEVERQPESLSSWVARLEFKEFDIAFFNLVEPSDSFLPSPLSCFCCVWCLVMSASLAQISAFLDATSSVFRDLGWHSHFQFSPNTQNHSSFPFSVPSLREAFQSPFLEFPPPCACVLPYSGLKTTEEPLELMLSVLTDLTPWALN